MPKTSLSFTVGITTNWGKEQLVHSISSLRKQITVDPKFEIILIADSVPLSDFIKNELVKLNVTFIENKIPQSALAKQKQLLKLVTSDLIILTQDDLLYDQNILAKIISAFESDPQLTFVGVKNEPLLPATFFEAALNVGTRVINHIGRLWNGGDNYISVLGRTMAFRTSWLKKLDLTHEVISEDAYLYFKNKKAGGKYRCIWDSAVYFRNPNNLTEHLAKSSRFQSSEYEMNSTHEFNNLGKEYKAPVLIKLQAGVKELVVHPMAFGYCCLIFAYTRIFKKGPKEALNPLWKAEKSTKSI